MTTRKDRIEDTLTRTFAPQRLVVIDESHQHAGHQGMDGTAGTHIRVRIVAETFAGMTRIARHRAVTDALKSEIDDGLHALAIEPAAPGEPTRW
ncbi:BolA family protein [Rhizobium sp. NRK18]|jgi:BolA family transcriptional regulator, general stress-responsive regulator|uniref:BolA family protein n=1 Tax=Rhizobium sp. NRK18 TaxID=2964667 RepID=UPI0021C2EFA3|nr:BolA family transcriptional regulator [Rhizobium sp. NRK18]MCQ2003049.1 BolA family transcriptional regulator [Rhizobium sp. NRK18]